MDLRAIPFKYNHQKFLPHLNDIFPLEIISWPESRRPWCLALANSLRLDNGGCYFLNQVRYDHVFGGTAYRQEINVAKVNGTGTLPAKTG